MGAKKKATLMEMIEMLPEELREEILVRLPVKSLVRFSCVSKVWHDLFMRNPCFRHKHTSYWRNKNQFPATFMLKSFEHNSVGSRFITKEALNIYTYSNNTSDNIAVSCPLGIPLYNEPLAGSCDGILCLFGGRGRSIRLCNPITKEIVLLPPSTFFTNRPSSKKLKLDHLGFGHDASTNDYKVVRRWYDNHVRGLHVVEVYKLTTNSWTMIESTGPLTGDRQPVPYGVHVNGLCYWLQPKLQWILTFDFETEKFGKMECPKEVTDLNLSPRENIIPSKHIGVLDDSVAIFVFTGQLGENQDTGCSILANVWAKSKNDDHFLKKLCVQFTANVTRSMNYILNFFAVGHGDVTTLLLLWLNGLLTEVDVGKRTEEEKGCVVVKEADSRSRTLVHSRYEFSAYQSVSFRPSLISLQDFVR